MNRPDTQLQHLLREPEGSCTSKDKQALSRASRFGSQSTDLCLNTISGTIDGRRKEQVTAI